jgi:hypothetical protein
MGGARRLSVGNVMTLERAARSFNSSPPKTRRSRAAGRRRRKPTLANVNTTDRPTPPADGRGEGVSQQRGNTPALLNATGGILGKSYDTLCVNLPPAPRHPQGAGGGHGHSTSVRIFKR